MVPAPPAAGEIPDQPRVHGPGQQFPGLGPFGAALTLLVEVLEDPPDLRPREVGGQRQPGDVPEAVVAVGVAIAWMKYWRDPVPKVAPVGSLLTRAARNDLYQDQVNEGLLMRPGIHATRALVFADQRGVDGAVGGLAALVGGTSARVRKLQNGLARSYALTMLLGVVVILGAVWVMQ